MPALPLEVLITIFEYLECKDLTQCQLASKLWNQASLKKLYTNIKINTEKKSFRYVRTIKNSPRLGKYLETIDTGSIFQKQMNSTWDKPCLLDTIINYCPNVLVLDSKEPFSSFWTKLMYAASQGRLSHLQSLATPVNKEFESYIYTALSFKNTITTLDISDLDDDFTKFFCSEIYSFLCNKLNQFPCLQTLALGYNAAHRISYYDTLINECSHLKTLSIITWDWADANEKDSMLTGLIIPHQNIHTFRCKWDIVRSNYQLNYIMQKFPNLKSLTMFSDGNEFEYDDAGGDTLMKFVRFATNLQKAEIGMVIDQDECLKVWGTVINEKYSNINIIIGETCQLESEDFVAVEFTPDHLKLELTASDITESYCIEFLSKIGNNIQSLFLRNFILDDEVFKNIESIAQVIKCCPSLQHLKLGWLDGSALSDNNTYAHTELKILSLYQNSTDSPNIGLESICLMLPNLKKLIVDYKNIAYGKSRATVISIPHISLDNLKLKLPSSSRNGNIYEIYIRLKVKSDERFYLAFEDELSPISTKRYNYLRPKSIYLDITCQNLIELGINSFNYKFPSF